MRLTSGLNWERKLFAGLRDRVIPQSQEHHRITFEQNKGLFSPAFFPAEQASILPRTFHHRRHPLGEGSVALNKKITLRIAVTVVDVLANGHLLVSGLPEIRVNFELRELQVVGIVQPEDISRRNEITYDKIAGARISYGGRGRITEVQQPRYGQQIFEILAPF